MSGFKEDIINILKHCVMFHKSSRGLLQGMVSNRMIELMAELNKHRLITSSFHHGIRWDYIVIPSSILSARTLLQNLTRLSEGGILILEITGKDSKYEDKYKSFIGNLKATKVIYEDRAYLVIHTGDEYGN